MLFAVAPSQNEFLNNMILEPGIDWASGIYEATKA